jgi:hypothetical protein
MRRTTAPFAPLVAGVLVPILSCSSSGQANRPNGPVYGTDGSADVVTDNPPDASFPTDAPGSSDAPSPVDVTSHPEAGKDGGDHDGASHHDASHDAATDSNGDSQGDTGLSQVDASACPNGMGTIALLGGTSSVAFGAVSSNGRSFSVSSLTNATVAASPALISFGTGEFLGLFTSSVTEYIDGVLYSPGATPTWSTPTVLPALAGSDAGATELGSPGLAALGSGAALVYQGGNDKFYHGVYASGAWEPASDPVETSGAQDYGPSPPAVAVVGSTLYAAYDGGTGGLYVNSWTSGGGWAGAVPINGAGVTSIPPTLLALTGGTADLMLVFEDNQGQNTINFVLHTPSGGWQAPAVVASTASTTSQASLAPLPSGGAVLVYQGMTNGYPYGATYDPSASTPWTTPVEIYPNSLPLQSPPTVATGTCGVDAIAALVETTGVALVTLKNGTWAPPLLVTTLSQMTFATIATAP